MLIKSVYDLLRAFVVASCNHLVTAVTVENQHVKQNNPLNGACLDIGRRSIDTSTYPNLAGNSPKQNPGQEGANGGARKPFFACP
jgi:hypothetical protein